jgi:hypothetical protein
MRELISEMSDDKLLDALMFWIRVGRNENGLQGNEKIRFKSICDEVKKRNLLPREYGK